ncbi:MAG: indolepyruvate oxidoreductase subunit beta [Desulfobulbus propionicus]|nr:MAG: indolepyruvate oxidoreductase subunit beta [Desulfobulbus propionicus]
MKDSGSILFSGVGGQGILLASEVIAYALLEAGYDAKKSEVHGMAQRGGSVTAELRYGRKVYSPLIEPGQADLLMAFEMMEAARYLPMLHAQSRVIVNTQKILPPAVATGKMNYPEDVLTTLVRQGISLIKVDAFELAKEAGEIRTVNIVMVGVLSTFLPMDVGLYTEVISSLVKEAFREVNLKAFELGRKAAKH